MTSASGETLNTFFAAPAQFVTEPLQTRFT